MSPKLPTLSLGVIPFAFAFAFAISMAFGPTPIGAEVYTSVWDLKRVAKFGKELHQSIPEGPMRSSTFYTQLSKQLPCLFDVHGQVFLDPISIVRMVSLFSSALNATTGESPELREFITRQAASLKVELPSDVDVVGAVNAIVRLQLVYNVTVSDFGRHGFRSSFKLDSIDNAVELPAGCADALVPDAQDCALIAHKTMISSDENFKVSKLWMKRAIDASLDSDRVTLLDVVRQHAKDQSSDGGVVGKSLLELVTKADQDPTFDFASAVDDYLRVDEGSMFDSLHKLSNATIDDMRYNYRRLCRESTFDSVIYDKEKSALKCTYENLGQAYYLIGPVKTEWVTAASLGLRIYHDVISDTDIRMLQKLALSNLKRSTVNIHYYSEIRVSKFAWLPVNESRNSEEDRFIKQVRKRDHLLAGMNTWSSESLKVLNYGLGGQFEPHIDFVHWRLNDPYTKIYGNRIATLMYYLSDVEAGGSTAFTNIGVAIRPKKGSAVFWYNMLLNGDLDHSSLHAGCPVIIGEKWVMDHWFRYDGQFNRRLCSTDPSL